MASVSGINTDQLVGGVKDATSKNMQNVADLSHKLDFTDPGSMVDMQMAMMKMNMGVQMESAMIKSFEDMIKSVVQRM